MELIKPQKYEVTIELKSPLHIYSGIGGFGYQGTLKENNLPLIPASTIKGKLRDNFTKLQQHEGIHIEHEDKHCNCPVCMLFGKGGYQPSRVILDNFKYMLGEEEKNEKLFSLRPTVAIDRYRRVALDGALTNMEVVEKGMFRSIMEVYYINETRKYERYLLCGLKMIEAIGGGKSRGRGFVKVEVKPYD